MACRTLASVRFAVSFALSAPLASTWPHATVRLAPGSGTAGNSTGQAHACERGGICTVAAWAMQWCAVQARALLPAVPEAEQRQGAAGRGGGPACSSTAGSWVTSL